jgi:AcrR family transcriptional regulator
VATPAVEGERPSGPRSRKGASSRARLIEAAKAVFEEDGFLEARITDIAERAGLSHGSFYHYFDSKEAILSTLFAERWQVMLDAIAEIDRSQEIPARDKLYLVASFIIDSYRHEPELMKVIIVEVTRAANSFGREHLAQIREAYDMIGQIVASAQRDGAFKTDISADFAALMFYGAIEQLLSGWIFDLLPESEEDFENAKDLVVEAICGGLER